MGSTQPQESFGNFITEIDIYIKQGEKRENSQKGVIKFSVLFKILVLILKKEVHFLVFSFSVRL